MKCGTVSSRPNSEIQDIEPLQNSREVEPGPSSHI